MKALIKMSESNYNPREYIPETFIADIDKKLWRNHCLWAIVVRYNGKTLCIWSPDFTLI